MTRTIHHGFSQTRGSALVEFAFVAFQLLLLIFAALEFCRMVLVYTNVANAARVAARYAITHGSKRTGSGVDGPSGPGNVTNICNVVTDYAKSGLLDTSKLPCAASPGTGIYVTYPNGTSDPGNPVTVTVVYPYDPFTVLPLGVRLGSTTQGVITF